MLCIPMHLSKFHHVFDIHDFVNLFVSLPSLFHNEEKAFKLDVQCRFKEILTTYFLSLHNRDTI